MLQQSKEIGRCMTEKPIKKINAGCVSASIWENQRTKDGREFNVASVRIERRYRGQDGNWQSTNSFGKAELPLVALVVAKAFEYLTLSEREPNGEEANESK